MTTDPNDLNRRAAICQAWLTYRQPEGAADAN